MRKTNDDLIASAVTVDGPYNVDVYTRRREYGPGPKRTFRQRLARLRWEDGGPYDLAVIDVDDRAQCGAGTKLGWISRAHRTRSVGPDWSATVLEYDGSIRFLGYFDRPMAAVVAVMGGGARQAPKETTDGQPAMYAVTWGPGSVYARRKDGAPISLVEAMRESYGVGQARIWRIAPGGEYAAVVANAGSSVEIEYVPTGRRLQRRTARHLRSTTANAPTLWTVRVPAQPGGALDAATLNFLARRCELVERLVASAPAVGQVQPAPRDVYDAWLEESAAAA